MNRFEFTEVLRKSLSGRVDYRVVNENVAYYENYIDTEIRKGRSEKDVLGELGDPRLLAKTISGVAGDGSGTYAEDEDGARPKGGLFGGRVFRLPNWLFWLAVVLVFFIILNIVGFVLTTVLPILIPVAVVYYLIRYFRRRH